MPKQSPKKPVKQSKTIICNECLKWNKFGEKCWVYWERKKHCTHKVMTTEDWQKEVSLH